MKKSKKIKKLPLPLKIMCGFLVAVIVFRLMGFVSMYMDDNTFDIMSVLNPVSFFNPSYDFVVNKMTIIPSIFAILMVPMMISVSEDKRKKNRTGEDMGSADWIDSKCSLDYRDKDYFNNQIFTETELFSRNMRISKRNRNILMIGRPGTGKSRRYFKPNLLQKLYGTVVMTDPKGELLRDCGYALKEAGYTIKCLNLDEMWNSNHYNPLSYLKFINNETKEVCVNLNDEQLQSGKYFLVDSDVLQVIDSIMKNTKGDSNASSSDPFWDKAEALYLQSIMYYIMYNLPKRLQNFNSVLDLMRKSEAPEGEASPLDIMFDEWEFGKILLDEDDEIVTYSSKDWVLMSDEEKDEKGYFLDTEGRVRMSEWKNSFGVKMKIDPTNIGIKQWHHFKSGVKSEKTMASIMLSASARLAPLNIPQVNDFMCDDDMEMERLGMPLNKDEYGNEIKGTGGHIIWFVITKPNENAFNFIANLFYTQCFQMIDINAKKFNGSCPTPVDLYMDEWAQLGEIPRFVETLSYVRGLNCGITICLQSLDQLKLRYKDSWQTVIDDCDFILYLGSGAKDTLEYLVTLIGKETNYKKSSGRSYGRNGSSSQNWDTVGRDLVDIQEMRTLGDGNCILMDMKETRGSAYSSKLYDLETHPRYDLLYEPWKPDESKKYIHGKESELYSDHDNINIFFKNINIDCKNIEMIKLQSTYDDISLNENYLTLDEFFQENIS